MKSSKKVFILDIKSKYIIQRIFDNLKENKWLKIIKYNKIVQNKLGISINNYIKYYSIEIEIIPILLEEKNTFFWMSDKKNDHHYHIYFNDDTKETRKSFFTKEDNVSKIRLLLDHQIKNLDSLFENCKCIKTIKFIRFNKKDITTMNYMFRDCKSLEKIDLSNFCTDNVISMDKLFASC